MSKPGPWTLGGDPPEPQNMPTPTPEEAAAIRDEVAKVERADRKKVEDAVERGRAKGQAVAKAKADAEAKAAAEAEKAK